MSVPPNQIPPPTQGSAPRGGGFVWKTDKILSVLNNINTANAAIGVARIKSGLSSGDATNLSAIQACLVKIMNQLSGVTDSSLFLLQTDLDGLKDWTTTLQNNGSIDDSDWVVYGVNDLNATLGVAAGLAKTADYSYAGALLTRPIRLPTPTTNSKMVSAVAARSITPTAPTYPVGTPIPPTFSPPDPPTVTALCAAYLDTLSNYLELLARFYALS